MSENKMIVWSPTSTGNDYVLRVNGVHVRLSEADLRELYKQSHSWLNPTPLHNVEVTK